MSLRLTKRDYDCMLSISRLSADGWPARVKDISREVKVKPPTVVEFLGRLSRMSLVERGPAGYRLTGKGAELMDSTIRAHRLFETLLSRAGIPLQEACSISSSIERSVDGEAIATLCSHLQHPGMCPHGRPIPAGDEHD